MSRRTATDSSSRREVITGSDALVLTLLCAAQFMVVLDTTIVTVALPSIQAELGFATQTDLQYVVSLYALTFGGFLILAGRVADLYGRRRVFRIGLTVFSLASLACGLSPDAAVLLIGRALQGVGSAMISPAALSLIITRFPRSSLRNRALGVWGGTGGAAGAAGLIFGGVLTSSLGWAWVFFINVPIGVVAFVAAGRLLPKGRRTAVAGRLDVAGSLAVTLALGLMIFACSGTGERGWSDPFTVALLTAGLVLLAVFVAIERRVTSPVLDLRLFTRRELTGANVSALLLNMVIASHLFFTTLYVQRVLAFPALETGLAFLPNSALVLVGSALASRLATRVRLDRLLAAGFLVIAVSSLLLSRVTVPGDYLTEVLPGFSLAGLGLGIAFVAVTIGATRGVSTADQGTASGLVTSAQQVGFAIGVAAIVSVAMSAGHAGQAETVDSPIAGYSLGYVMDAALAGLAALLALVFLRARQPAGN